MQIGTGNNRLPGSAPIANEPAATPAPAPVLAAPQPLADDAPPSSRKGLLLVVVLLLAAAGGAYFLMGSGPKADAAKKLFAQLVALVPGMGSAATTNAVVLTDAQRKIVADYSPAKPINEAKRVKNLVRNRVADQDDEATNAAAVTGAPREGGATSNASAAASKPAATAHKKPSHPSASAAAATNTAAAAEKANNWPEIKVTASIGGANSKWFARINGQLVRVGDKIDGATVSSIAADHVTMDFGGETRNFHVGGSRR